MDHSNESAETIRRRAHAGLERFADSTSELLKDSYGEKDGAGQPARDASSVPDEGEPSSDAAKAKFRSLFQEITRKLDSSKFGKYSLFLNYGYIPDGSPQFAPHEVPRFFLSGHSAKLVLELVGECEIDGRRVLDVGCGRGGTVFVLDQFFKPRSVTGVDLAPSAVAFCRETQQKPNLTFLEGDSENLPFPSGSFDVITNVESSHLYPSLHKFYDQVVRLLAPGGHFLYTDMLPAGSWDAAIRYLSDAGLVLEHQRDITANILLACDEFAASRLKAFGAESDDCRKAMENFLAVPGSELYENMRTRAWTYGLVRLKKPS